MILVNGGYNVKLKRFNKYKYLNRYKLLSIIILFLAIVTTIIYYSNARYESSVSFSLINGEVSKKIIYAKDLIINEKNVQDIIDELASLLER